MRTITGLWRWRGNPLYRRGHRLEAAVTMTAVLLIVLASPLAGWAAATTARHSLDATIREQHRQRERVWATVDRPVRHPPVDTDPETSSRRDAHRRVLAQWTGPGGGQHSGVVEVDRRMRPGTKFSLWVDRRGEVAMPPLDRRTASSHVALSGVVAGIGTAGLIEGARRLLNRLLLRRRHDRWEKEWAKVGPDWGRMGRAS
ncbi:hypothetical protein [Streptomyces sp. NPDC005438]|uniref:Rv1733c family protein n=1 Tax=Streptomyces sp. NPDC005438 TaxID=3156880 RepID=UPI0033A0087B